MWKKLTIYPYEEDKKRCEKKVKEARHWDVDTHSYAHTESGTDTKQCLNMCEQWRESTRLREERLCLVFCCPWLLLSAGQHISLCWNQPGVVCVCVSVSVCIRSVCVSSESPGSYKCTHLPSLLGSLSFPQRSEGKDRVQTRAVVYIIYSRDGFSHISTVAGLTVATLL